MSKGKGHALAGARPVLTREDRIGLQKCLLTTAAHLLEAAMHERQREDALAKLWAGARQAEADIATLLGKAGDAPDFRIAATAQEPADAAAVIGEARAIVGAEAARIIKEADGQ